jgi:PAS domain S-box-containing protein
MNYWDETKAQLIDQLKMLSQRILQLDKFKTTRLGSDEAVSLMVSALDSSLSGIIITNSKGHIIYANTTFFKMFEYEDETQIIGKNIAELFDKYNENPLDNITAVEDKKNIGTTEFMAQTKNGFLLPVEAAVSNVIDDKGKMVATMVSFINITERKLLEEERINRQLAEEREKLSKLESLGRLAGGIAHDFDNILAEILENISLARTYADKNGKLDQLLVNIEQSCVKATKLTYKFITFSRGGQPLVRATSISELLRESCQLSVSGSNVQCAFRIQDDLWPVKVDETRMRQVFSNLVINAAEAMPDGGVVNVAAENFSLKKENSEEDLQIPHENFVRITIKDHGEGISKEYQSKVFDPYFSTKERGTQKGMGLGLSIVQSVMRKHNGAVKIESKKNVGTSCYLYIPAIPINASDTKDTQGHHTEV